MYHNPQAVVQVNGKRSEAFAIQLSVLKGFPLSPLLYVLALELLLRRLRDGETSLTLGSIPFTGPLSAKVSVYANAITVFVSRRLDIKAVKKAVARYGQIAGTKILKLSLKGTVEVYTVYILPLILYRFTVLPLPNIH